MRWRVPLLWEGGDVWIIGGGPSIPSQFDVPKEIVDAVVDAKLTPSAYSLYMKPIQDKHIIGINVAYLLGDWVDMVFFGDGGFFLANRKGLSQYNGIKISCNNKVVGTSWVKYLPKERGKPSGISTKPNCVCWNGNSGAAAISVAVHAGAKRIILLGFDMQLDENNKQHWHNLYAKHAPMIIKGRPRSKRLPFNRFLRGFPTIAEEAKRLGVQIINASPTSLINCFPKMTVKEILNGQG